MSRMAHLLDKAAEALDQGEDPFGLHFLSENDVDAGECLDMASLMAEGGRLIAWVMRNPRDAGKFLEAGSAGMALDQVTETMRRIRVRG